VTTASTQPGTPVDPLSFTPPSHHGEHLLDPQLPYDITARSTAASTNIQLQQFVANGTMSKDTARKQVMPAAFGEHVDDVRYLAGSIKQHALDHLDYYLEQFIERATAAGVKVHFAADSKQANAIYLDIAKKNNVKLCLKSKSMVTEETHLLPALEGIGVKTIETDLGEFILQLDNDAPSHLVAPMIHKDRTAVGRAFTRELGVPYTDVPEELTQIARNYLRAMYPKADMGISGGNFLVAETGSVVICTNEGNGRLCTSAPRIHVAFVGMEKMVPTLSHLGVLLKVLARSSTAQPLTCYTHIMTGPKRRHEHDGPEEMHVILLDNQRTQILREETREMLRCIRCGACLNACPVYRKIGGHAYGAVYSGPIGSLITPMLRGLDNYKDLPNASSLCGACYEACPVKINIPKYLVQLRADIVKSNLGKKADKWFFRTWAMTLKSSLLYRMGGWFQTRMFRLQAGNTISKGDAYSARGWLDQLPGPFKGWTDQRDMPTPPAKSFRQWWHEHEKNKNR